jgi:hypothetical protein
MRSTWFLILRGPAGLEYPALVYDQLTTIVGRKSIRLGWRLDRLPDAERLATLSLAELYHEFCWRRDLGTLPPENRADPPLKKADGAKVLHGHRETFGVGLRPDLPYEATSPGPPRPDAPAFIPPTRRP